MATTENAIVASIKDRIKAAREEKQMTQAGLAKHLDISRTAVTQWEAGLTFPSYEKLIDMSKLLNRRPEWLAFGVDTPIEYRVPTNSAKVEVISFGEGAEDRKVVGTHYLDEAFVRDTLRTTDTKNLFVYVIETESFTPRFVPRDHLIIDGSVTKVGEGLHLIWNGLSAQVVNITADYANPGSVILQTTEGSTQGHAVEVSKVAVLGKVRGRMGAAL